MTPLDYKIGLLRIGLQMQHLAERFNVSRSFTTRALNGERNSKLAKQIREYAMERITRKAA